MFSYRGWKKFCSSWWFIHVSPMIHRLSPILRGGGKGSLLRRTWCGRSPRNSWQPWSRSPRIAIGSIGFPRPCPDVQWLGCFGRTPFLPWKVWDIDDIWWLTMENKMWEHRLVGAFFFWGGCFLIYPRYSKIGHGGLVGGFIHFMFIFLLHVGWRSDNG